MIRIARFGFLSAVLALLAVTTEVHARPARPVRVADSARSSDLVKATRLVDQSRRLVSHAHRHDPRGYGGHEARAAALLRRAALELDEASDFKTYNARAAAAPNHADTRRRAARKAA